MCSFCSMAHLLCGFGSLIVRFFACLSCAFGSVNVMSYTGTPARSDPHLSASAATAARPPTSPPQPLACAPPAAARHGTLELIQP